METAQDGVFFKESAAQWASLDGRPFDQGVEYLRDLYKEWKSNPTATNEEGIKTAKELSWTNTANKLEEIIYGNQSAKTKSNV